MPADDYHLSPYSPCIDAGDPMSDYNFEPEPDGGRINMGAYGNTPEATCKGGIILEFYNLVSKTRVGRTTFDYSYTMTLHNNSNMDVSNIQVELLGAPDNISIIDSSASFSYIEAGESATSSDTFTLRINTLTPIDTALISWRATFDWVGSEPSQELFVTNLILEPKLGDLTIDGIVDYEDLGQLLDKWLWTGEFGSIQEDINKDGTVDFKDFAKFAENWLK